MGAVVVERHFTLDKNLPGPDHLASVEPPEFRQLVENIRRVEMILGSREKRCAEEERQMASVSRKSLVAARPLPKGTLLTPDDLTTRRPGTGVLPFDREHVLGRILTADVAALEPITWTHLA
jgi:sialic acid synthase SpsE